MSTNTLVRLGILALPVSGVLGLVALISRYGTPNASVDPKAAARTASSLGFFVTQFVGNVLGLTLLIFGILALTVYLANTPARRFAVAAMIFSILGVAPALSALGVTTYALPVLGNAYLNGQQDILPVINDIFNNPLRIIFDFVFLFYAVGFILFGVAIWRSGVLRKGAALSGPSRPPRFQLHPAGAENGRDRGSGAVRRGRRVDLPGRVPENRRGPPCTMSLFVVQHIPASYRLLKPAMSGSPSDFPGKEN